MFTLGVAGFGVASLLCALAPTVELLVVARALQGVSGALLTPASLAIIVAVFPESERGAAIGSWTAWGGIGYLAGPLIGGQIIDSVSWRWVFALNVPLVLLTLALAQPLRARAARPRRGGRPRLDVVGALLCALGLAGISFGLIEQPVLGWSDPLVIVPLVGGVAAVRRVRRLRAAHAGADAAARAVPAGATSRWPTSRRSRCTAAWPCRASSSRCSSSRSPGSARSRRARPGWSRRCVMFLLSRRFGALADRYGPRWFMAVGPLLVAAGFLALLRLDADTSYATDLVPALLLYSLGLAVTVARSPRRCSPTPTSTTPGSPRRSTTRSRAPSGLLATAAVGAVLAGFYADRLDSELAGRTLTPAAQAQVAAARDRALSPVDPAALPAAGPRGRHRGGAGRRRRRRSTSPR